VVRGAGSKGGDLIAGREGSPTLLIEVKATAAGPWSGFVPADRKAMLEAARKSGWEPLLVWWPTTRKHPRFIPAAGWPPTKGES
jgi:Holliday junction resolvase